VKIEKLSRLRPFAATLAVVTACGGEPGYVQPPLPAVTVAPPVQREVTDYIEMTGTVASIGTVEIRARVEGFLQSIEFGEGDTVEEGALLYVIDPSEYQARADRAEAAVGVAKASLDLADASLKLREQARKTGAVSELEVMENRAQREVAAARLDAARSDLRRARLDLGYTRILAPVTGRVGRTLVDPGNLVYDPIYAYFSISERALLQLSDSTEEVREEEDRLARIREIPVELGRSNDEGYPFQGSLHFVDPGIDPETGTLLLRAIFENPQPLRLFPGIFARGRLPIRTREGVLLVNDRALGSDQRGRYVLVVDDDDVAQYRPVKTGALIDGMRVIEKGIGPSDRVITNGLLRARPGAKVKPELAGAAFAVPPSDESAPSAPDDDTGS
jgi:RND family efflux transporter MFP subunit